MATRIVVLHSKSADEMVDGDMFVHPGFEAMVKHGDTVEDWMVIFHSFDGHFVWYDEDGNDPIGRYGLDCNTVNIVK